MTVRRVWEGGPKIDICANPVFPNGIFVAYVNDNDDTLNVRDLPTGESRILVKGTPGTRQAPDHPVFWPDSRHVAYTWTNQNGFDELRVVGAEGGTPKIVYRNA